MEVLVLHGIVKITNGVTIENIKENETSCLVPAIGTGTCEIKEKKNSVQLKI